MNFFAKRIFIILILILLVFSAFSVLATSVTVNANIPSANTNTGGGGGGSPVVIPGCTDPAANNYNPSATTNDGSCSYAVSGCTDQTAINYNSSATVDDGSCILPVIGCTDPLAINYNPSATTDNGSCVLPVTGCTDSLATNYNSLANQDDGSCNYAVIGCTDPLATNYNSLATTDDGSCTYNVNGCTNPLANNYNSTATIDDGSCVISGCTNTLANNYNSSATIDDDSCIILGCTDEKAINYNSQATVDSGNCSYDSNQVPGCMDASATNYNSSATIDNGSCTYLLSGCNDKQALNYNPSANINNGSCVYSTPITPIVDGINYYFFTNNNGLELFLSKNNIDLLINHNLLVVIPNNFSKEVDKITGTVAGELIPFKYDIGSNQYILQLNSFNSLGKKELSFLVTYADNSTVINNITVTVYPLGRIFSKVPTEQDRIFGINTLLYDENNNLILEVNKIGSDGAYGFMVKNGRYKLVVFDNGEKIYEGKLFTVKNNIINQDIGLTFFEKIIQVVEDVLNNPVVEETNKYVAPATVGVVSVSTLVAIPWWNITTYFQYIFTEPLAWFFRRKKKGWGVVYNSITKKPIDLAVVRLYDKVSGRLLKSKVTDKEGRYSFLVSEGDYNLEVIKPSMIFPSNILMDTKEDKQFVNLYHGETISITRDQKGIITANIPIDSQDAKLSDKDILRGNFWYRIQKNISAIGPIFSIISFAILPTLLIGSFAVIHITLYLLFKRLAAKEKVNKWGIILDAKTGKPLAGTVAKIYSPEYNKMLEAQVTDRHGRYGFLAGNNIYYISASKGGYEETKTDNIDLTHKKSEEIISRDIKLQPLDDKSNMNVLGNNDSVNKEEDYDFDQVEDNHTTSDSDLSPLKEMANKLKEEAEVDSGLTGEVATDVNLIDNKEIIEKNKVNSSSPDNVKKEDKFG